MHNVVHIYIYIYTHCFLDINLSGTWHFDTFWALSDIKGLRVDRRSGSAIWMDLENPWPFSTVRPCVRGSGLGTAQNCSSKQGLLAWWFSQSKSKYCILCHLICFFTGPIKDVTIARHHRGHYWTLWLLAVADWHRCLEATGLPKRVIFWLGIPKHATTTSYQIHKH